MDEITLLRKIDETCVSVGIDVYPKGFVRPLSVSGVKARVSTVQSPMMNLVGMATLTEAIVDESIQRVVDRYRQEKKIFGWLVGPTSQPTNLGDHLHAAGFTREVSLCGMVLRDLRHALTVNPVVRVEQVQITDFDTNSSMLTQAFGPGMTEEAFKTLNRFYEAYGELAKVYFAYLEDRKEPVAFSVSVFDTNRQFVGLRGAATLKQYRGKGIYSAMVAKRLEDAQEIGATSAIIHAVKETSAPICAKLGFETVCSIDFYTYRLSA